MKRQPVHDTVSLRKLQRMKEALRDTESFPYSEELRSVMVSPVLTCGAGESVKDVAKGMARREVSSVVVVNESGEPVGILTERDILKKVMASERPDAEGAMVGDVMTPGPVTLSPGDTIYRALSVLYARGVKHLPLVEGGRVAGMVTLRQLLKLRHPEPMLVITRIEEAREVSSLREIKAELPRLVASKLALGISAYETVGMLSLINQDLHRKALELAIGEHGPPPAGFCLFVTGSHGRMENLLTSDQDHGMILAEGADDLGYFMPLSKIYSEWLGDIGFELCPGYIMSMNPTWRKNLKEWKVQVNYWFERQGPHLTRYMTLLFDAIPLYGDEGLFHEVSAHAWGLIGSHFEVLRTMHEEEGGRKVPVGLMGKFLTEKKGEHQGELDLKKSGLIFIVEGIRVLALLRGVRATSTRERINGLVEGGFIHPDDGEYFESAYEILLHYALRSQVEKALRGERIDTYILPRTLSATEREFLRHALRSVSALHDLIASEFGELVL